MGFDPFYTGLITTAICQVGVEVLERWKWLRLAPVIRRRTSIERLAEDTASSPTRQEQIKIILLKLTRSLDEEGRFRIQRRVSVDIMTGLWEFCLLTAAVLSMIIYPDFWYDALIKMEKKTAHFWVWQHVSGSIVFYYLWFLAVNRQGAFPWGTYIHHGFAILAAGLILNGSFLPHALWYGTTGTSLAFMVDALFVWRGRYAFKSPEGTQLFARFTMYWYAMCCLLNLGGQIFITINGVIRGVFTWVNVVLDVIMIAGWVYDDQILLRALYEYSVSLYSTEELKMKMPTQRVNPIDDLDVENQEQMKPAPIVITQTSERDRPHDATFSPAFKAMNRLFSLRDSMHHTNRIPAVFTVALADPVPPITPMNGGDANGYEHRVLSFRTNMPKSPRAMDAEQLKKANYLSVDKKHAASNLTAPSTSNVAATATATVAGGSTATTANGNTDAPIITPQTPILQHPVQNFSDLELVSIDKARMSGELHPQTSNSIEANTNTNANSNVDANANVAPNADADANANPDDDKQNEAPPISRGTTQTFRNIQSHQGGVDLGFVLSITQELARELDQMGGNEMSPGPTSPKSPQEKAHSTKL